MNDDAQAPELQRDVQRLLGRSMLRLQQYERLLKALLATHQVAGTTESLADQVASQAAKVAGNTLGQLVNALTDSLLVAEGSPDREILDPNNAPNDRVAFGFRSTIVVAAEDWEETRTALTELVGLRNELVHHLLDRFNLCSRAGCEAAIEHLTRAYARIDERHEELRVWARSVEESRTRGADLLQSQEFHDFVVDGISPGGAVDWPNAGLVRVLREGVQLHAQDGWACLATVEAWVAKKYPEQTPARYGCRGWPQALHDSRVFDMQYRPVENGGKEAWIRERATASKPSPSRN